nr:NucA/NucB deoxyribonuclease domain-containing protein [Anoxybacillus amylolyticus]
MKNGHPDTLTISRKNAKTNRKEALKGHQKVKDKDLDEYPPAMFKEGGKGASVKPISPSDNRGAGSSMGHQLRKYPDGTKVKIRIDG